MPHRSPPSIFQLLSAGAMSLDLAFDASVPEGERGAWRSRLLQLLADTAVEVAREPSPHAAPVSIRVSVTLDGGRTDQGTEFFAARAIAVIALHRARVEVTSRPGVAETRGRAVARALADLAERVATVLSW
jgi:hypothetical protein